MVTLIPAATERMATAGGIEGNKYQTALPKQAPAQKNGKMKPPLYPPATVKETATSLATPARAAVAKPVISKPVKPVVGQI